VICWRNSYLAGALQFSSHKLDALVLNVCIRLVRQVSSSDTEAMSSVTDTVALLEYELVLQKFVDNMRNLHKRKHPMSC